MKFSTLPWFTQREIIDLVIADHLKYRSVSKEWFECVAVRYGVLSYEPNCPKENKPTSLVTRFTETVHFGRCDNIDWSLLEYKKNIEHVSIDLSKPNLQDFNKFMRKLLKLSCLKKLSIKVDDKLQVHIDSILMGNQSTLSVLKSNVDLFDWTADNRNMIFPNLVKLSLCMNKDLNVPQDLTMNLPKLQILSLSCLIPKVNLSFTHKLSNLVDLDLKMISSQVNSKLEVDLNSFPNLKSISTPGMIKFIDVNFNNKVEKLTIEGNVPQDLFEKCNILTKLKDLSMEISMKHDNSELIDIFKFCTKLTSLELISTKIYAFPSQLPIDSYTVTSLSLKGIVITSQLLKWLSACFKLIKLRLERCLMESHTKLEVIPFYHLRHIVLKSKGIDYSQLRACFTKKNYPHLRIIQSSK